MLTGFMRLTDTSHPAPPPTGPSRLTGAKLRLVPAHTPAHTPVHIDARAHADAVSQERETMRRSLKGSGRQAIENATDPRWVLAVRTAERLEGAVLTADRRSSLVRLGEVMGLTLFDANLIIASVQDQARRGYHGQLAAEMAEPQVAMVLHPHQRRSQPAPPNTAAPRRLPWRTAAAIALILAGELALIAWVLG